MRPDLIRRIAALLVFSAALASSACTSIRSKLYDTDNYCGGDRQKKCLTGIPITLDVPTHVKITITESQYVRAKTDKDGNVVLDKNGNVAGYELSNLHNTRQMSYELVTMKELYTVDFKRPAAGINDLKLTFGDKSQYFTQIQQDVTDVTIDKIAGLIQAIIASTPTLANLGKVKLTGADQGPTALNLIEVPRVVACEFFDVHQPNLEQRIQAFLEQNINVCTEPCPIVVSQPALPPDPVALPPNPGK